jgi:hypothetical protein
MNETVSTPSWTERLIYFGVIGAATIVPLFLHVRVSWWLALITWFGLVMLYDRLFVARTALCMGMGFTLPLVTGVLLIGMDVVAVFRWFF